MQIIDEHITYFGNIKEPLKVVVSLWSYETVEGKRGKVADCHLAQKDL